MFKFNFYRVSVSTAFRHQECCCKLVFSLGVLMKQALHTSLWNFKQAIGTSCKLLELMQAFGIYESYGPASLWNYIQAHGIKCKLMKLHAGLWNCRQASITPTYTYYGCSHHQCIAVTKTHYLIKFELLISSFLGNS